ncbi:heavy metal translocating P-type ATPase [Tannerella sp. CAG:118]|nr:heavy metal translocating P-type ATPase [Tannerella sp. CAG:118]
MEKITVPVLEMSCAVCANNVENEVRSIPGVDSATVNFATNTLTVSFDPKKISLLQIKSAVQAIGYDLVIEENNREKIQEKAEKQHYQSIKKRTIAAWILSIPLMGISMTIMHQNWANWVMLLLTLPILLFCGQSFYINAWKQFRHKSANMDTLVSLSTIIAFLFSLFNTIYPDFWTKRGLEPHVYYEAAGMIIAFVLLGKLMESKAKNNTSSAIKKLMGLQPQTAHLLTTEGEKEVPLNILKPGDLIRVKPGEKVPVDGIVFDGNSYVDESMISGEPIPVEKQSKDKVLAGTINQKGTFSITATQVGTQTILSQIVRMVQEAQGSKAPVQRIADKISSYFVPIVIIIAIITFIVWLFVGGNNFFSYALLSAVSVLVIACPCALGLATPTALMVGIGRGAENHILIKDAFALENLCKVNCIVLDKTGTITQGHPAVTAEIWLQTPDTEMLSVLLSAEQKSEHPLALAMTDFLLKKEIQPISVTSFQSLTGQGITVEYNKNSFWVGSLKMAAEQTTTFPESVKPVLKQWQNDGQSIVCYGKQNRILAIFALSDPIKESSKYAISSLQKKGIEIHLLTGDNRHTANSVALKLGIKNIQADALPSSKEEYIKTLQNKKKFVAMVGDGINDSQALARADVSIAMGKGTDIAMDVAMITLITSDLSLLSKAINLSRRTVRIIRENLFWAFIYNIIGIPIAAGLLYPICGILLNPMWASAAMAFSSVSVVLNSLRLKWIKIN